MTLYELTRFCFPFLMIFFCWAAAKLMGGTKRGDRLLRFFLKDSVASILVMLLSTVILLIVTLGDYCFINSATILAYSIFFGFYVAITLNVCNYHRLENKPHDKTEPR